MVEDLVVEEDLLMTKDLVVEDTQVVLVLKKTPLVEEEVLTSIQLMEQTEIT